MYWPFALPFPALHGGRGHGEGEKAVRERIGHLVEGREVHVVERVTRRVVAGVVWHTGRAAPDGDLVGLLGILGAREQPASGDADGHESS